MIFLKVIWLGATALVGGKFFEFFDETRENSRDEPPPLPPPAPVVSLTSDEEQIAAIDRTLSLTGGALAMAAAGAFISPGLRLLSWPFLVTGLYPSVRDELTALWHDGRLRYQTLEVIQAIAELAMGYIGLTAGGWLVYTAGERVLLSTRRNVKRQLASALGSGPELVWLVQGDVEVQVPLEHVVAGDLVAVRAGDMIPVDGVIVDGAVGVDQRALTGESRLKELGAGDTVQAATTVLSGHAIIRTERTGRDTVAARVEVLIAGSTSYEQQLQARVTRVTDRSVAPTLLIAGYGYLTRGPVGILGGFWTNALDIAWLSSPLSMRSTAQAAAQLGMFIKDGRSLELLSQVDTVVFDKTGTLTLDRFAVHAVHRVDAAFAAAPDAELLRLAAALEGHQHHPIARAIADAAGAAPLPDVDDLLHQIGYGVGGTIAGRAVALGSRRMMANQGVALSPAIEALAADVDRDGHSAIYLAIDGRLAAVIELAAQIRPEAQGLVAALRRRGLDVVMITGDDAGPAHAFAAAVGIETYFARALPEDKAQIVDRLQAEGRRICFVGDGINDAIALHRATVSVSLQGASTVAVDSAQIVVSPDVLARLPLLFEIGARYAADQRVIMTASKLSTAINVTGFLLAGFSLSTVVGIYLAGFGVSLAVASLPRFRRLPDDSSKGVTMFEDDDSTKYNVVVNHEEQYSIWPADRDAPEGWRATGFGGTKAECLAHINTIWTDMRPRSLRDAMATK